MERKVLYENAGCRAEESWSICILQLDADEPDVAVMSIAIGLTLGAVKGCTDSLPPGRA